MKPALVALFLLVAANAPTANVLAQAFLNDGDGLLDVGEAPGFPDDPAMATGYLDLTNQRIEDLDGAKLLTGLWGIGLGDNQITSLESGDFDGLTNLRRLNLWRNQITSLESGDFDGLNNLERLVLGGNQIPSIESSDFDGLTNLQVLHLGDNQIASIESGDFDGLTNLLDLSLGGNQITSLKSGAFDGLTSLRSLVLENNQITSLESGHFDGLTSLGSLNLRDNQITSLKSGAFDGLTSLRSLELRDNQLSSLTIDALHSNVLLELSLSDNLITSIEPGAFAGSSTLQTLFLAGNDLTELDFTGATFEHLSSEGFGHGLVVDSDEIVSLVLNGAELSLESFINIVNETNAISDVSLVGLTFRDEYPLGLHSLLGISTLDNVAVDPTLYGRYAPEFDAFAAMPGNTMAVVPEPSSAVLLALGTLCIIRRLRHQRASFQRLPGWWTPLCASLILLSPYQAWAFRVLDFATYRPDEYSHLGIARWDAAPHSVDGVERSLDGGLRYSLEGGSYEAFRDQFTWSDPAPTVAAFQAAVEGAFAVWEAEDPDSGLGTDLYFVADLETPTVIEPPPASLADVFLLNRGSEIDISSANLPVNKLGEVRRSGDPDSNSVTLTSGVPDYPAAVFSGVDILMAKNEWSSGAEAPWNLAVFRDVLAHEIGHALGFQHPDRLTGRGGSITSAYYDDNYDGTSDATALGTLTNSFAALIDPLDPDNSPALGQFNLCTSSDDPCSSRPGVHSPGVELLMEAIASAWPDGLSSDEFAGRQFLYPYVAPSLAGDFNGDGTIDGADFLRWQRGQSPVPLSDADLIAWEGNYGATGHSAAFVTEPQSILLSFTALMLACRLRHKPKGSSHVSNNEV